MTSPILPGDLDADRPTGGPTALRRSVMGHVVDLVNWLDYEGWEVRLAVVPGQDKPVALGYLKAYISGDEYTSWTALTPKRRDEQRGFSTPSSAIWWLLRKSEAL